MQQKPQSSVEGDHWKAVPRVDVKTLLRGNDKVILLHRGHEYQLRVTRQGKLLLAK
jgi:hemin uptake protein HemP